MNTVSVDQYRLGDPVDLPEATIAALVTRYQGRVDVHPTGDGRVRLAGTNYVGTILCEDHQLVVRPKVGTLAAYWMLSYADRLANFGIDAALSSEEGLLEILAARFTASAASLIRRGLYKTYVERTDQMPYVRGRILPLQTLRTNLGRMDSVVCRFAELTVDVPHNQVLAYAADSLSRFKIKHPATSDRLDWVLANLRDVRAMPGIDLGRLTYDRLSDHYLPAHRLADLILSNLVFRLDAGVVASPSFLVNMDEVFQEFLTAVVTHVAEPRGELVIRAPRRALDRDEQIVMRPDIVVTRADGLAVAVIDAKYKVLDPQSDVYQALAYAKGLGVRRVALVYPGDGSVVEKTHAMRYDDIEILVRTVPISVGEQGFDGLSAAVHLKVEAILRELGGLVEGGRFSSSIAVGAEH